jgi:anti-sigma-K factor RskA
MTHADFESIAALDVLGAATAGEASALRSHLLGCIPCRRARDEYADALTAIALDLEPVEPPRELRARVAAAVESEVRKFDPWWLAVAATLFLALWGWRELGIRVAQERDASQTAEIERLRLENQHLSAQREALSGEIAAMAAAPRTIELTGQEVAPAASARVFIQPDRRRALVFFHDLPANTADKSYQLWIIRADQAQPMSAGVFDATADGSASISVENLPVDTEIKGLAVTLERKGGSPQPTNTKFIVAGNT